MDKAVKLSHHDSPWQENRCADSLANLEHCSIYVINFNEEHPFDILALLADDCMNSLAVRPLLHQKKRVI